MRRAAVALVFLVAGVISVPVDPLDEVELIAPKRTTADVDGVIDEGDFGGFPGIIVVQRRRNPFFNPFDELFGRPDVGVNQGGVISGGEQDDDGTIVVEESLPGGLGSFFGPVFASAGSDGGEADIDEEGEVARCGLICSIFKHLEARLQAVQEEIDEINRRQREKENEVEDDDTGLEEDDDDKNYNTTYTEKVLPDGSVVKINRTVVSDTSDDGTSFFFHSTSFHNVHSSNDDDYGDYNAEEAPRQEEEEESDEVPMLEDEANDEEENVGAGVDDGLTTE